MSLTSYDGVDVTTSTVDELCSHHEEADNKIILHSIYASNDSASKVIVVRSPDTDVFVLLLHHTGLIAKNSSLTQELATRGGCLTSRQYLPIGTQISQNL